MRALAGKGAGNVPADSVDAGARLTLVNIWKTEKRSNTKTAFVCLDKMAHRTPYKVKDWTYLEK